MCILPIEVIKIIFGYSAFEDQSWTPIVDKNGKIRLQFNKLSLLHDKFVYNCIALWGKQENTRFHTPLTVIHSTNKGHEYDRFETNVKCTILKVYPRHGYYIYVEFKQGDKTFRGTVDTHLHGLIMKPHKEDIYVDNTLYGSLYDGWIKIDDYLQPSLLKIIKY